jgi:hypothetical protein
VLVAWGLVCTSLADDATSSSAPVPEAKAEQAGDTASESESGGFIGQFMGTIDDFYSHPTPAKSHESRTADHDPQTGTSLPPTVLEKSAQDESAAPARDASTPPKSQETKSSRVARTSTRVAPPRQDPSMASKPATAQRSAAPRWAQGGLLESLWGDEEPQDPPAGRVAQRPTQQAVSPSLPQPSQTDNSYRQSSPDGGRMTAKTAGAATKWMNKMVSPLFGKDEPTERQASTPPPPPPPARRTPIEHPAVNQPLARTRTVPTRPAPRKPTMEPSVAIQFGHTNRQPTPSHSAQAEMQLAQTARPKATASDIMPIVEGREAAERSLAVSSVDLADMLPSVAAAETSRLVVVPGNKRTPTLADEYRYMASGPAGPPTSRSENPSTPAADAPLQPSDIAAIKFASSIDVLGLAELTGQTRKVDSTKPNTEGGPVGRTPAIEVAKQPRLVR